MRPTHEETWLNVARVIAERGTCARRRVGCVLVDAQYHVLSTGYNGPAGGEAHCTDHPCPGARLPSGTGLDKCEAIHAEANALLQCRYPDRIQKAFVTTPPCMHCTKLLMNTNCREIVCMGDYPQANEAQILWCRPSMGRSWNRQWTHFNEVDIRWAFDG